MALMRWVARLIALALCGWLPVSPAEARSAPPGKPGGTRVLTLREDPPEGFAINETATIAGVWPIST